MSFHDIENPSGGVPMEHNIEQPAPEQHLLEQILSRENMELAWKQVRANKDAPGVDGSPSISSSTISGHSGGQSANRL
jgi:RNA-directed DNA polymerase